MVPSPEKQIEEIVTSPVTFYLILPELCDMTKDPGFTVKQVAPLSRDGRELVKVEFSFRAPKDKKRTPSVQGWAVYDPSRFWVIREFEGQMVWNPAPVRGNATISATIDYEETPDGIPILKQITRRIKHLKDSEPVSHRFDFDLREDNVRASEFTLAAFGLPEPPARSWSLPLFLGTSGVGVVCLVLSILLRLRAREGDTASPRVVRKNAHSTG